MTRSRAVVREDPELQVRHHLREEEPKFFKLTGRLLSATKEKQLARGHMREVVRMRTHYAAEYETVAIAAASGLVKPAKQPRRTR